MNKKKIKKYKRLKLPSNIKIIKNPIKNHLNLIPLVNIIDKYITKYIRTHPVSGCRKVRTDGISTIIQCSGEQKLNEIYNNFILKSNLDENNINYIYNGKGGDEFDKNLTFNQIANSTDKKEKK